MLYRSPSTTASMLNLAQTLLETEEANNLAICLNTAEQWRDQVQGAPENFVILGSATLNSHISVNF